MERNQTHLTSDSQVRVRFAPSPTGALHVGSARTALFNWLFARNQGGTLILRIEDTDTARSSQESTEGILDGLRWLGLEWDEGPGAGGDRGPYFQSQRFDLYRQFVNELEKKGRAYRCYCTQEEIDARRQSMIEEGKAAVYDRKCRSLTQEERARLESQGRPYVLRLLSEDEGETVFHDLIRGEVRFQNQVLDDFVLVRSDGRPTYNFAVVVDDHLMEITHVIRGEDHISNTPRQIQVYQALEFPIPTFAHMPMILGPDRSKLSKRHGAQSIMEYAAGGYLPEAMVNYLALLGWAYDDKQEIFGIPDELIEKFSIEKVSKAAAIFDVEKLEWMNGVYIRDLKPSELAKRALPFMKEAGIFSSDDLSEEVKARFVQAMTLIQTRIKNLAEVPEKTGYFFTDEINYDENAVEKVLRAQGIPEMLEALLSRLVGLQPWTEEKLEEVFNELAQELDVKRGKLMQPTRVAVTGSTMSPGMFETLNLLGRAKTCERLKNTIEMLKAGE